MENPIYRGWNIKFAGEIKKEQKPYNDSIIIEKNQEKENRDFCKNGEADMVNNENS